MNKETITVLISKLKGKQEHSNQFETIVTRIKKAFKKEFKYREIRNNEKSTEFSKEFSKKNEEEIKDIISGIKQTEIIKIKK